MVCGKLDAQVAYNKYLSKRAEMSKLQFVSNEDTAIIKICNLIRVYSPNDAKQVKQSYYNLPVQVREMLTKELIKDGITDNGILLYYAPATLSNAVNYFKSMGDMNAINKAMELVLPILANIYGLAKAKISKAKKSLKVCTVFIADVAEKAKNPLELQNYKLHFTDVNDDYNVSCEILEKINVPPTIIDKPIIAGSNVLVVALGGGSDCIQATMVAKFVLKGCRNVISIRTQKTSSQNEKGEMNKERKIYNPKEVVVEDVYICDNNTSAEGRFFENMPSQFEKNFGKYLKKIQLFSIILIEYLRGSNLKITNQQSRY